MPVHVFPLAIRAVVTDHHAVRIYYWTDPELVHFSQLVAKDLLREKEVNKTMYDKGAVSLSTVLPAYYDNHWLFDPLSVHLVRDLQNWNVKPAKRCPQRLKTNELVI